MTEVLAMPSGYEQLFPAFYDKTTKIVSTLACVLLLVIAAGTRSAIVAGIDALIIGISYAWSPRGYAISGRSILVKRLIGNARIALDNVSELRAATPDDFQDCIRLFGNGGLFGYYGTFRTSKLGDSTWYLTNRSNAVVIAGAGKTALVSPDDREGFLAAARTAAGISSSPSPDSNRAYGRMKSVSLGTVIGITIGVIGLGIGILAISYSPGPPSYTLTPGSLTIHDRFYPVTVQSADVDVSQIRVVDLNSDNEWQPTERTNGFANSHYWSGWFRLPNGQRVRLYSAGSRRLVLIPPKGNGTPVLLETRDADAFAEQLRREWSQPA